MNSGGVVHLISGINGDALIQGFYAHNKMLKFGIGGKFLGEGPFAYNHTRLREIDLVSVINVDNDLEVACNINKEFHKYTVYADIFDILQWCNTHPNLLAVGRREGTVAGIPFIQYFFGFTRNTITLQQIEEVFKVNG